MKKFAKKKLRVKKNLIKKNVKKSWRKTNIKINKNKFIESFKFIIIIILITFSLLFSFNNKNYFYLDAYNITSDKWIVMTTSNSPTNDIINLEMKINNWKIVVIGNNNTIDSDWDIFKKSIKLIYLSIKEQKKLGYNILKFLNPGSYCRKNIGYLFAIQHGAKEIYEIDENLKFSSDSFSFINFNVNNSYICYGKENNEKMINPYVHFGETNIWPRGFLYKDVIIDYNKIFYYAHYSKVKLKPMVYQGLINGIPDVDSFFLLTNTKANKSLNIYFSNKDPLLYLSDNYVPINSKNTKYSYEIFPFLMLPITINESISDILRGYIIERFSYLFKGIIAFHNTNAYNDKLNYSNIINEREMLMNSNKILDIIKSNKYSNNNSMKLLFKIINELIKNKFLKNQELKIYKAFLKDLVKVGYKYTSEFNENIRDNHFINLNFSSEIIYYIPTNQKLLRGNNNYSIIKHSSSDKLYNDILLIINYNFPGFLKLNQYIEELYKKYFPNIVYIYPDNSENSNPNIISCDETKKGVYSYECIKHVYEKFPNYKGYLYTNDDNYMKVWEFDNLDFSIPWFYIFDIQIRPGTHFFPLCKNIFKICDNDLKYKQNYIQFFGFFKLYKGLADFYYIPNNYFVNFIELAHKMYGGSVYLECAVPSIFALLSTPKIQMIYIRPLMYEQRKGAIKVLRHEFQQMCIHPIKFSDSKNKEEVNKYIYFINAIDF